MNKHTIKILQHNVSTWNNKKITLSNIYNQHDPDIILLNETSVINGQALKIFNYNTYTVNRANERYAGAAIAIKKDIKYRLFDNFHSDMLAVTIDTLQGPITIATMYTPPRTQFINLIDLNTLFRRNHPTYLIGDLNASHPILGHNYANTRGRNINTLIASGKCTHVGPFFPTYINGHHTTTPDIMLQNRRSFYNIHMQAGPLTPSNHIPILINISASPIQIPIKPRQSFHRARWYEYKRELERYSPTIDHSYTLEEIDRALEEWTSKIQQASQKYIPIISYRTIPGIKPNQEALNTQIIYQAAMDHMARTGPSRPLMSYITRLRNNLNTIYNRLYTAVWNEIMEELKLEQDMKKFWTTIKKLHGSNEKKQHAPYIRHNNEQLDTAEDKERVFREHWQKIFTDEEDENYDHDHIEQVEEWLQQNIHDSLPYHTSDLNRLDPATCPKITIKEVIATLRTFKQKTPGPTGITFNHLRHLPPNMFQIITHIFNHSLSAGYFPDNLKRAIMIFLPKPGASPYAVQNYRPISLLDVQSKLFGKILNNRFTNYLILSDKMNVRQHGFKKGHGTHTALAIFHETIVNHLSDNCKIDIVLRDVSKAFDKVWHTGLKYKLLKLNMHPSFTRTLCDFITDRTAAVRISGHTGHFFELQTGVPQGSCLSPTLYSFYTHDLPDPVLNSELFTYADDITQIIAVRTHDNRYIAQNTEVAIESINTFEKKWKIKTNMQKFTVVPIARRNTSEIIVEGEYVPYQSTGKVLGLNFSSRGYSSHLSIKRAMAWNSLRKLYRFRNLSTNIKRKLYLAYIRSALTYPIIPMHTFSTTALKQLQKIQNAAIRFITNVSLFDEISARTLHQQSRLEPLNIVMHNQAQNIWEHIKNTQPDIFQAFENGYHDKPHGWFRSSRLTAMGPRPVPLYK
jgi:hypothetical protein